MALAEEYARQWAWRPWRELFEGLPPLRGSTVLDLGCAVGDQAAELASLGARVVGFDGNPALLQVARAERIPGASFHQADLRALPVARGAADGLWCSFVPAYFCDLVEVLRGWRERLRPGGWIALTEVDDLFGHEPLGERTRRLLAGYADASLQAGRYDFRMGRRLAEALERAGCTVVRTVDVADRELAFDGPAPQDVLAAWRSRLERMGLLRTFCGLEFEALREDFLACLARADHRATARVVHCLALRPGGASVEPGGRP